MAGEAKKVHGTWSYPGEGKQRQWLNWWFLPLEIMGMIGPLIGAVVSLIVTIICLWIVRLVNIVLQSQLAALMIEAVDWNIAWFFVVPLVIGYCQYFARRFYAGYLVCMPIGNAAGFAFSTWIIAWVFRAVGTLSSIAFLYQIGAGLRENLLLIFALVLLLGYVSVARMHLARSR
ncbi:MAG: hypothetical protein NTX79_07845 [Candidatus Micrarchaeota archaeon]|nr:hypothetical protein [Candidatus Micrarchaeota archaeon]